MEKDILQYNLKQIYSPSTYTMDSKKNKLHIQNKSSGTKNEFKGVEKRSEFCWRAVSVLFEEPSKKYIIGNYKTKEDAHEALYIL